MMILALLCLIFLVVGARHLPLCGIDEDTYGRWENLNEYESNASLQHEVAAKFIHGGPGEALSFNRIWLPHNCSVHRFTNASLHSVLERIVHIQAMQPPYRINVMADSALRGIMCGVMRILSVRRFLDPMRTQYAVQNILLRCQFDITFIPWKTYALGGIWKLHSCA
jgi:hypothetical protein